MLVNRESNTSELERTPDNIVTTYAQSLLKSLGVKAGSELVTGSLVNGSLPAGRSAEFLWADSGAMWLTGHANESPRMCAAPLAACAQGAWLALSALAPDSLDAGFDAHRLLGERAATMGLQRQGRASAGGACKLYDTANGLLALNLTRRSDYELLPAWLQEPTLGLVENIDLLPESLKRYSTDYLIDRARLLGLAAASARPPAFFNERLRGSGSCGSGSSSCAVHWFREQRISAPRQEKSFIPNDNPLVIDLSALWAGPLCSQLLGLCGARVIKVESVSRPDGARTGAKEFFDLLNGNKESVALNLDSGEGVKQLRSLLEKADIVIESSRPRALEQMGIYAKDIVSKKPGMVWLGITGYGRGEPMRDWIAYGDDAGVAAGLSWLVGGCSEGEEGDPVFCGDAIADPLTGLHAAVAALVHWKAGGGVLLDVALHDVVAYCISEGGVTHKNDSLPPHSASAAFTGQVTKPVARLATQKAAALGSDTQRVLKEFGL